MCNNITCAEQVATTVEREPRYRRNQGWKCLWLKRQIPQLCFVKKSHQKRMWLQKCMCT